MANRKPLIDDDGEVRDLTEEDFTHMKPFSSLPEAEQRMLRGIKNATIEPDLSPLHKKAVVDLSQDWELEYWCRKFDITRERLIDLVREHGKEIATLEFVLRAA